jgi:hypothetical protein
MGIAEQTRTQIIRLIYEGESLDPDDLESFYGWMQASYEALGFHEVQQERFEHYCRSSYDSTSMRLYVGVWMLKQSLIGADGVLNEDIPATLSPHHA